MEFDTRYYSVPYQLVHEPVEVRATAHVVEVLHRNRRVASHVREYGRRRFITNPEHMPAAHRAHLEWTPSKLVAWGASVGPPVAELITTILTTRPHPEHGYRACMGLKRLVKQYGGELAGQHPVGTGPYKFVEWVRDDHITLEANPNFFRKGLPKTKRVIMRVIKDNAARFLAVKAGEVHAMEAPNVDDVKAVAQDPNLKLGFRPAFNTGWIRFNMNNELFKDKRIRQAVAYAINRKAIVDGLYAGYGEVAQQHMPPVMWGRVAKPPSWSYDPSKAKALLAEAKYPNGFSLDFWYIPVSRPYFPAGKEIGTAIASDLGKVGIRVHLMTEDWAAYLKDRKTNKFPIFMIGWIGDNGDPDDWLGFFFPKYDKDNAYLSYNNPAVFDLINKAKVATSQDARAKMYAQAEAMLLDDVRDIPLAHAKVPLVMRKNVEGLVGQPDANEYMETVELK